MEVNRDLRQRHIDAYFPHLREVPTESLSAPEFAGVVVRAAVKAGLITGLTVEETDDLKPGVIVKLAKQVNEAVAEALTIPPD